MNIRNFRNYKPSTIEVNEEPSQVIQEPVLGIREMLSKVTNGEIPLNPPTIQYFDPVDVENIRPYFNPGQLDFTDLDNLKVQVESMQNKINSAIQKAEEKRNLEKKAHEQINKEEEKE